ncbi:MAG TPA: type II CAAX endopeptidase family protein, partial [Pyrinomonadaceae bacterium]|nr:type II CAAX endopeptidase family protein [Pyrinomonadaceae bacterium]
MEPLAPFLNQAGRLRSGWRVGIFVILFVVVAFLLAWLERALLVLAGPGSLASHPLVADLIFRITFFCEAILAGWLCNKYLEGLPWRALGLTFHRLWWWDLLFGSIIGALSLGLAALIAFGAGGLRFSLSAGAAVYLTIRSMASTGGLFLVGALAEEALFRGYPLQTLTRARLAWLAILLTSLPFAAVHLSNPNVAAGFTFVNTALAGVWLAAAYLRTRSLWFPLGVHWAWNWTLGSVLGLPVSGLNLAKHTLLKGYDLGPAWLTGGDYGIEGGLACTIVLIISTLF